MVSPNPLTLNQNEHRLALPRKEQSLMQGIGEFCVQSMYLVYVYISHICSLGGLWVKWHDSWNAKNPRTTANSITNRRMDRRLSRNKCKFACTSSLDLQNRLKSTVNVTILLTVHGMGYYSGESLLESTILLVKFHVRYRYITCERRLWNPLLKIPGFH